MKARVFFIMTLLLQSVNVKASNAKEASPAAHGSAAPQAAHGATKAAKEPDSHAAQANEHAAPAEEHGAAKAGAKPARTDHYVHHWLAFPAFKAMNLSSRSPRAILPSEGRITVLVFLASWCVPCQQQIREFKEIEAQYRDRFTDFVYIFAHDTESDARGFANVYKLGNNAMLASADVLEKFHQPELPSYYVSDRYQWLIMRRLNTQKQDLIELAEFLNLHTAF